MSDLASTEREVLEAALTSWAKQCLQAAQREAGHQPDTEAGNKVIARPLREYVVTQNLLNMLKPKKEGTF